MVVDIFPARAGFLFQPTAGRDIHLATDDRLDAFSASRLIKINRAVKNAVVGDADGGKLQLRRFIHQFVQTARSVEERILRMQMKVNKVGKRHAVNLTFEYAAVQAVVKKSALIEWNRLTKGLVASLIFFFRHNLF